MKAFFHLKSGRCRELCHTGSTVLLKWLPGTRAPLAYKILISYLQTTFTHSNRCLGLFTRIRSPHWHLQCLKSRCPLYFFTSYTCQALRRWHVFCTHTSRSASTLQIRSLRLGWYRSSLNDTQLAVAELRLEPQLADILSLEEPTRIEHGPNCHTLQSWPRHPRWKPSMKVHCGDILFVL